MVIIHSPRCFEYGAPGYPETPDRVRAAVAALHRDFHTWLTPVACADEDILRTHAPGQIEAVKAGSVLYSSVSGKVIEVNSALDDDLMQVSHDT
mgnify:CR=1 FL=1